MKGGPTVRMRYPAASRAHAGHQCPTVRIDHGDPCNSRPRAQVYSSGGRCHRWTSPKARAYGRGNRSPSNQRYSTGRAVCPRPIRRRGCAARDPGAVARSPLTDPAGPGDRRGDVVRGGSYLCHESYCNRYRVAPRTGNHPDATSGHLGFRRARDRAVITAEPAVMTAP
ncbi:SUMF1/EgtB/PvdO family nonheme iron enzyme [Nocardia farcinica]|uniref:SUMF1/EgtB/PvdO family nonheme iron enzyme n=2 Tax=Nocardia farcinica TaxID=37329 RepID=UPI00189620FD|nr:SUMF1/EgtB/PvdO family nonheme iron enzyme [Nocardia farcinica]MBF6259633.1 SUMF1/EgtB/PvdO family nonheme iron enzyme [Nocardia farcinica]MBF6444158.1 SUMF1/EgtB/PvdO family nonheme iron enzyme [Nocardia farcinica]MBF6521385.1 SUMF1/EgtB/PvdO family nonheme iron enzyme [Nocardia farcinica]